MEWAEIIDGALFPSAEMPVELKEPALKLMTWVENNTDPKLAERFILDLTSRPLGTIAADPYVTGPLGPVLERHKRNIEIVRRRSGREGAVVYTDLCDEEVGAMNKFIVYYLHPDARYSVTITTSGKRVKLSVGSNPWSSIPRTHNIAALCERYGGGGHPVVGGIPIADQDVARVRTIAREVAGILGTTGEAVS
jgi:hypothetical protein